MSTPYILVKCTNCGCEGAHKDKFPIGDCPKCGENKMKCDVCRGVKELTYSSNLEKYMCDDCWDSYGETCYNGLA